MNESNADFIVHSVEEPPEEPESFVAYVPVLEEDTSPWEDIDVPIFEAEVVRASPAASAVPRGRSIRYSLFAEPSVGPTGDLDVLLAGPSGETTEIRVAPEVRQHLPDDVAFILEPEFLGRTGRHTFRGADVEFVPDPAQDAWRSDVWLPIARIHRPKHPGCTAVYTAKNSEADTHEAGFAIAGLGAKGQLRFGVTMQHTYQAEATCKEACVYAKIAIIFGTTYVDKIPFVYGNRIKVWDIDPTRRAYRDIPAVFDQCGWSEEKTHPEGRTVDHLRDATGGRDDGLSDAVTISRETSGTMSLGVEFSGTPVTLSVGYTRNCSHEAALQTQFVPGADYLGYLPRIDNPLEKCWTVLG